MEGLMQKHYKHRIPREPAVDAPRINLTWRWIVRHDEDCALRQGRNRGDPVVGLLSDAENCDKRSEKRRGNLIFKEVDPAEEERRKQRELRFQKGGALTRRDPQAEKKKKEAGNSIGKEHERKRDIGEANADDEEKRKQRELRFQAGPPMMAKPVGLTKRVPLEEQVEEDDDDENRIAKKRRVERFQSAAQASTATGSTAPDGDSERAKKRMERFGTNVANATTTDVSKKLGASSGSTEGQAQVGASVSSAPKQASTGTGDSDRIQKRMERFAANSQSAGNTDTSKKPGLSQGTSASTA